MLCSIRLDCALRGASLKPPAMKCVAPFGAQARGNWYKRNIMFIIRLTPGMKYRALILHSNSALLYSENI